MTVTEAKEYFISIHVPRVEDDGINKEDFINGLKFQSTSPVWRTTFASSSPQRELSISIHVPRVEDDV